MATAKPTSERRAVIATWIHRHLLGQRTLPLAVMALWGCLLALGLLIHPPSPRDQARQGSWPFISARGTGVDYYQFWVVGRAQETLRLKSIYSLPERQRMAELGREALAAGPQLSNRLSACVAFREGTVETFSTPFLYAATGVFASGRYDLDYDRFMDVCLAAMVFSIGALGWLLGFSAVEVLLFAAVTILWSDPLASDLRVGNVNQLQLAGVALYLLTRRLSSGLLSDLLGGAVLGLLVAFKPTLGAIPMLLALAWAIDRRWRTLLRQAAAAVASAALAAVMGCLFLDSWSAWLDWTRALPELDKVSDISVGAGNYSLAQVIVEAMGHTAGEGLAPSPILLILVLALAGFALRRTRPVAGAAAGDRRVWFERDLLVTALGCALSVVALRLVWLHYYVLMTPLLLCVLRPGAWVRCGRGPGGRPRLEWSLAGLALGLLALAAVFGRPLVFLAAFSPRTGASLYIAGAWGLMLLGLAGLWSAAAPPSAASTPGDR